MWKSQVRNGRGFFKRHRRVFGGRNRFAFLCRFIILTAMQLRKKDAPCEY